MGRLIKDNIVLQQLVNQGKTDIYLDRVVQYSGEVDDSKPKTNLKSLNGMIPPIHIIDSLKYKYSLMKAEGDCQIVEVMNGEILNTYAAKPEDIRMLRALAAEQISNDEIYSDVVATVFKSLMVSVISKADHIVWKPIEYNEFYRYVYDEMQKYVSKEVRR